MKCLKLKVHLKKIKIKNQNFIKDSFLIGIVAAE